MTSDSESSSGQTQIDEINVRNRSERSYKTQGQSRKRKRRHRMPPPYETYHYEPLKKKLGSIRLLNLLASNENASDIVCEFVNPDVNNPQIHPYEALSWCWGKGTTRTAIYIRKDDKRYAKQVSPNLFAALKALRDPVNDRYLWIDAICIDQENLEEKNHQVEMIVCIWLGEKDRSSRQALRFIKEEVLQLQNFDELCDSVDASGKWVVQEIALAQKAMIYCGKDKISWSKFAIAVELFVEVETATHRLSEVIKNDRNHLHVPGWFDYVSALGASLLVDATERLFREDRRTLPGVARTGQCISAKGSVNAGSSPALASESDHGLDSGLESNAARAGKRGLEKQPSIERGTPLVKKNRIQPLLSLEYLVSSLTIFETTVPHDTVYALLAIAKDTTPSAACPVPLLSSDTARDRLETLIERKRYNVDYKLPYVNVCKDFIQFCIQRALRTDRSRALDIICRPWATEEKALAQRREEKRRRMKEEQRAKEEEKEREDKKRKRQKGSNSGSSVSSNGPAGVDNQRDSISSSSQLIETNASKEEVKKKEGLDSFENTNLADMPLPSWIPQLSEAPYGMYQHAGCKGPRMRRKNADPLVGLPSATHKNYSAAESRMIDMKSIKFRKRVFQKDPQQNHFSMYVRGFQLDIIDDVEHVVRNGHIPKEWADLAGWTDVLKEPPPDAFWRTLVADRGRDGKNPPIYYSRACQESFTKGGYEGGAVSTSDLINYERNSVVSQFCRRVQAVIWNRALVKTISGRLGLVGKHAQPGDKICILYGCSVPVVLRESDRKAEKIFETEIGWELNYISTTIGQYYRGYAERKKKHRKRKAADMGRLSTMWEKETKWRRHNGWDKTSLEALVQGFPSDVARENIRKVLTDIIERGGKSFADWRYDRSQRDWQKEKQKFDTNKGIKKSHGKKLMDEIMQKRMNVVPQQDNEGGCKDRQPPNAASATEEAAYPDLNIDWWSYELMLKAGRHWRSVVRQRKNSHNADWKPDKNEFKSFQDWFCKNEGRDTNQQNSLLKSFEATSKPSPGAHAEGPGDPPRVMLEPSRSFLGRTDGLNVQIAIQDVALTTPESHPIASSGLDSNWSPYRSRSPSKSRERPRSVSRTRSSQPQKDEKKYPWNNQGFKIKPRWIKRNETEPLSEGSKIEYDEKIRKNLRERLGEEGYFSYRLLGECYIHGMMDGEAMLHQNEGFDEAIPSMVFEIR